MAAALGTASFSIEANRSVPVFAAPSTCPAVVAKAFIAASPSPVSIVAMSRNLPTM